MGKKTRVRPTIKLIGNNSTDVTGSMIQVITPKGRNILLECGMTQGSTVLGDYTANYHALDSVDCSSVEYCFILHNHADHHMLSPVLVKNGMNGKIITNHITAELMKCMLIDGAYINRRNAEYLTKKLKREYEPLFTEQDVAETLNRIYEYDFGRIHELDEEVSFRLLKNSHVLGAASLELFIKDESNHVYKIFYSSDLGNTAIPNRPYLSEMEYCKTSNISIFESTYGLRDDQITKHDRNKEVELLKKEIVDCCIGKRGSVVVPCFSFSRSQEMMTILYQLFNNDERFKDIQFIVDSNLTKQVNNAYLKVLEGQDKELFEEVLNWKNLRVISDFKKETMEVLSNPNPQVIISSSGFCDHGHIREYIKRYVSSGKNTIIFCGYSSPNSLAGKILSDTKTVTIDDLVYKKKAKTINLKSFSSHMQKKQLVEYMVNMNTNRIILIHGSKEAKENLRDAVRDELRNKNKTTNVIVGQKGMKIRL